MGCESPEIRAPPTGSSGLGAEISMPAIGPATVGLSGVSLFSNAQAPTLTSAAHTEKTFLFSMALIKTRPFGTGANTTSSFEQSSFRAVKLQQIERYAANWVAYMTGGGRCPCYRTHISPSLVSS